MVKMVDTITVNINNIVDIFDEEEFSLEYIGSGIT